MMSPVPFHGELSDHSADEHSLCPELWYWSCVVPIIDFVLALLGVNCRVSLCPARGCDR